MQTQSQASSPPAPAKMLTLRAELRMLGETQRWVESFMASSSLRSGLATLGIISSSHHHFHLPTGELEEKCISASKLSWFQISICMIIYDICVYYICHYVSMVFNDVISNPLPSSLSLGNLCFPSFQHCWSLDKLLKWGRWPPPSTSYQYFCFLRQAFDFYQQSNLLELICQSKSYTSSFSIVDSSMSPSASSANSKAAWTWK